MWMDLSYSRNLKELSDLSTTINLQELDLTNCSSLVKLPSSIRNATSLVTLNPRSCSELVKLPACAIGNLHKLSKLILKGCSKLEGLSSNINLESLQQIDLAGCSLLKRFSQISTNIEHLRIQGTAIEEVISSIMPRLDVLDMSNCENFKEFPHAFSNIKILYLSGQETRETPPWIKRFYRLRELRLNDCRKLVSLKHILDSLQHLDARNCKSLETLDWSSHNSKFGLLDFRDSFKLNKEARDLIIQTSTRDYAVLPGGEVPVYFTHRAIGDSVTIKLNGSHFPKGPLRFKVCVLLANKSYGVNLSTIPFRIVDKHNGLTVMSTQKCVNVISVFTGSLCIFEDEAQVEVTCRELVFDFKRITGKPGFVRECGVKLQLMEHERD